MNVVLTDYLLVLMTANTTDVNHLGYQPSSLQFCSPHSLTVHSEETKSLMKVLRH